jgi:hypothetical protein
VQRRTLLQLALAASAGAALPASLGAQPTVSGHPAAMNTLVDRVTNYDRNKAGSDKRIWNASQLGARNAWFTKLAATSRTNVVAISATENGHLGTAQPGPGAPRDQYDATAEAMRVVKDKVPEARQRMQNLLLDIERHSMWCAYQVGYRQGWCDAARAERPQCSDWTTVKVKDLDSRDLEANSICKIEDKCHDNSLTKAPDDLVEQQCPGRVHRHESY